MKVYKTISTLKQLEQELGMLEREIESTARKIREKLRYAKANLAAMLVSSLKCKQPPATEQHGNKSIAKAIFRLLNAAFPK